MLQQLVASTRRVRGELVQRAKNLFARAKEIWFTNRFGRHAKIARAIALVQAFFTVFWWHVQHAIDAMALGLWWVAFSLALVIATSAALDGPIFLRRLAIVLFAIATMIRLIGKKAERMGKFLHKRFK